MLAYGAKVITHTYVVGGTGRCYIFCASVSNIPSMCKDGDVDIFVGKKTGIRYY